MNKGMLKILMLSVFSTLSYAAIAEGPFTVETESGTTLPTTVIAEGVSYAFYTVTNVSGQDLINNSAKYLPENVTQEIHDPAFCGKTFNLQDGDYCILKLNITGAVVVDDPNDPANQVIVCNEAGVFCNAAADLLEVDVVSALAAGEYCDEDCFSKEFTGTTTLLGQRQNDEWVYVTPQEGTGDLSVNSAFNGVACAENFCMAAGGKEFPLLALSPNGASEWNYKATFSHQFGTGALLAASCTDNFCVSGGSACPVDHACGFNLYDLFFIDTPVLTYSADGVDWGLFDVVNEINEGLSDRGCSYLGYGFITGTGCADDRAVCTAAGGFDVVCDSVDLSETPLLLTSDEDGDDWQVIFPEGFECDQKSTDCLAPGFFAASSCSEDFCMAGGAGQSIFEAEEILLAVQDGYADWKYASDFMREVNSESGGVITSVNCFESLCVVGGKLGGGKVSAEMNGGVQALLAYSNDGFEHNWTYVTLFDDDLTTCTPSQNTICVKVPFFESAAVLGVSVYDNVMVAVGYYTLPVPDKNADTFPIPLLLESTDYGRTWTNIVNPVNLPTDFEAGLLGSVSCEHGICVVGGTYFTEDLQKPLIAEKIGNAKWTVINKVPADFVDVGIINGVNTPGADASGSGAFLLDNGPINASNNRPKLF